LWAENKYGWEREGLTCEFGGFLEKNKWLEP